MTVILKVEGISKSFGGLVAVKKISFSIEEGEIFGIIGPNGAGKTTLLNLISNMYIPNEGKIIYNNKNIIGLPPNKIAKMGLVRTFQSTVSYSESTVWENMMRAQIGYHFMGLWQEFIISKNVKKTKKTQMEKAEEILRFLDLDKFKNVKAKTLPYGYQKLLGLAIGLSGDPKILMLDEPAAGLNLDERVRLMNAIQKVNEKGVSIILVEHDMKVIMGLCQRILVLNYGEMITIGIPSDVQKNEEVIKAYLGEDHEFN